MIVRPKIRGYICVTAHPTGCARHVRQQIEYVKSRPRLQQAPRKALIIGASTGYGLATRIVTAFGGGASTLGVYYERSPQAETLASAGWYNSAAFEEAAAADGLWAKSINGDAFSHEVKQQAVDMIREELGEVDMVIYSLASPRRVHPDTGNVHKSVLKPVGSSFTSKTLNTDDKVVEEITLDPATEEDIAETIKVMGGEDWELWIDALLKGGVLSKDCITCAYSYIGSEVTWPVYRNGTIGHAKADLDRARAAIQQKLDNIGGKSLISVNKAVVTQASSAIPVVPLYFTILFDVMKDKGLEEGCIEQMQRLFENCLYLPGPEGRDEAGRLRLDDWELRSDVQEEVARRWKIVNTENLYELSDAEGYEREFLKLFGFGLPGIDYDQRVDPVNGWKQTSPTS